MPTIANIRVGKPRVAPDLPSHVQGVPQGNEPGGLDHDPGYLGGGKWSAQRSTGINPEHRQPIDRRMPVLPPA